MDGIVSLFRTYKVVCFNLLQLTTYKNKDRSSYVFRLLAQKICFAYHEEMVVVIVMRLRPFKVQYSKNIYNNQFPRKQKLIVT